MIHKDLNKRNYERDIEQKYAERLGHGFLVYAIIILVAFFTVIYGFVEIITAITELIK